jgi:hypothetical protein
MEILVKEWVCIKKGSQPMLEAMGKTMRKYAKSLYSLKCYFFMLCCACIFAGMRVMFCSFSPLNGYVILGGHHEMSHLLKKSLNRPIPKSDVCDGE